MLELSAGHSALTTIQTIIADERNALTALHDRLPAMHTALSNAVNTMLSAKTVLVSGIGKSGLIAQKISATLTSTGTRAIFLHPVEALHGDIGIAEQGDCAILLSKSGSTQELITLLPVLKDRGIMVIALVGNTDAPLAHLADIVLDGSVEREACPLNIAPMSSTTVALALGDALAGAQMTARGFTAQDFARFHPQGQLGRNLTLSVQDIMHTGEHIPLCVQGATFREALIEITRKGLGCVCVVNEQKHLLGMITDGDVRRILQQNDDIRPLMAEQVMTKRPMTIRPHARVGEALTLMEERERQIGVLAVTTADHECVGIIRVHDIVRSGLG
jgi:arabinose-5-phosphate isomerase